MNRILVSLGLLSLVACNSPTEPLGVVAAPPSLKLTNPSDASIYYFIVERVYAARINWGPCANPRTCAAVPPHATSTVPYDDIGGYAPGAKEAIVYWWHLMPRGGTRFEPDSIRGIVVQL